MFSSFLRSVFDDEQVLCPKQESPVKSSEAVRAAARACPAAPPGSAGWRSRVRSHTCPSASLVLALSVKFPVSPGPSSHSGWWEREETAARSAMSRGSCPAAAGTSLCGSSSGPLVLVAFCLPLQAIEKLVTLLNTLDRWIDETPPVDQPSRFGNKAYRTWYAKLDQVRLPQDRLGGWAGGRACRYQNPWGVC